MNRRLYWAAVALYCISLALPATFIDKRVTAWGWEAALYSFIPLLLVVNDPPKLYLWLWALGIAASNLAFIAAAILVPLRKRRAGLACIVIALASMIYAGFAIPRYQSELMGGPAGHLGPGYYAWVIAGALLLWTAFSSRSAR